MIFFSRLLRKSQRVINYKEQKQNIGVIRDVISDAKSSIKNKGKAAADEISVDAVSAEEKVTYLSSIRKYSVLFSALSIFSVVYTIYLFAQADYKTTFMGVLFIVLCLVLLLKYRMMRFQLVNAPKRVSVNDYFNSLLGKKVG